MKRILKATITTTVVSIVVAIGAINTGIKVFKKPTVEKFGEVKNFDNPTNSNIIRLKDKNGQFFCTGFVLDGHYAITAAHCLDDNTGYLIQDNVQVFNSRDEFQIIAEPVGLTHSTDYGLLRGDFRNFAPSAIESDYTTISFNKLYMACGYPLGQKKLFCSKIKFISPYNFQFLAYGLLYPGMSGGPVIDPDTNRIVALNSAVMNQYILIAPLIGILGSFDMD